MAQPTNANLPVGEDQRAIEIPEVIHDLQNRRQYQRGRFLGKGGFAKCYEVTCLSNASVYACKVVNKKQLQKQHQRDKMSQEVSIHRSLSHEYVVGFHSYFEDDLNVYLVLELCAKKSLMELQKRRKCVTETEARYFLRQILEAVMYLHDKKIIHRDLKLGNIFINEQMNLKLGDFGLATTVTGGERKKTLCGTPNYLAPEVLSKRGHSFEVDIWSVGCILYTLLVGKPPFETQSLKDTYARIKRGEYNMPTSKISAPARKLISSMLQVEPSLRPTAKQVLNHEFLTKQYIPSSLPTSVLTMQPRFNNRTSYVTPLRDHNPSSPSGPIHQPRIDSQQRTTFAHMEGLQLKMKVLLSEIDQQHNVFSKILDRDEDSENPNSAPLLYITKWVDYSDKYGFGYQLSDDSIGVSFNDLTRMILLPDGSNMHYIDKTGDESYHTRSNYPEELQKKVKLLNYFQQYMSENLLRAGGTATSETANMTRLPNMYTWFRTSRAVVMVLSNGTLQINNFRDHTKMILCPLMEAITTMESGKPMRTFKFDLIKKHGCTSDMKEKLKYAFEKVQVVLTSKNPSSVNVPVAKRVN